MTRTTPDDRLPEDRERGSMHVMTIPIAVGLLSVAILVIAMLGTATDDRREAGTAADAAALAATQEWDEHLGLLHGLHLGVSESAGFWDLAEEALLGDELKDDMTDAARAFAERNGAELTYIRIYPDELEVYVEVQHDDTVPSTTIRSKATATAGITLRGGLCVGDDGLGWLIDGLCATEPEPDEEDPDEEDSGNGGSDGDGSNGDDSNGDGSGDGSGAGGSDEDGDDEDEEDWTPPDVSPYSSSVVLID